MTALPSPTAALRLHPFILVVAFLSTYYIALLGPILPAIAEPLGAGAFGIGMLFATYALAQFLTAPVLGALADRFGRRTVLLISMCGVALGFTIFTVGAQLELGLWALFLGWIIAGAFDCWVATAFSYVADVTSPEDRTRNFAVLTAAIGSAFVIGPLTSLVLSEVSPTAPLFALLALLAVATIVGFFAMPESLRPEQRMQRFEVHEANPLRQIATILSFPQLRLLLLAYFLFWPGVIALSSVVPVLMGDVAQWGTPEISAALLMWGVIVVVMQLFVVRPLLRRVREMQLAIIGGIVGLVAFVMIAMFPFVQIEALLWAGVALWGVGQPLVQSPMVGAMSTSMGPHLQGRVQGAVAATMALAQVFGPAGSGALYEAVAPAAPFIAVAALIAVSVALMIIAAPRLRQTAHAQSNGSAGDPLPPVPAGPATA